MGAHLAEGRIPLSYEGAINEYWAIQKSAGLADLSHLGLLEVTGRDRVSFLNALLPSDLSKMDAGTGVHSAFLNTKARVLADLYVYAREEDLLIDTGDSPAARVREELDRFVITEDVKIKDVTPELVHLTLQGPNSAEILRSELGISFPDKRELDHKMIGPTIIVERDRTHQGGYDLIIPQDEAEAVWQNFLLKGVTPVGMDALEILRLEAGIPRYGVDVDDNTIILEAGFKDTISFSKGCYLGQEVVARATHIGRVNKNLVQFQADSEHVPSPKSRLSSEGKEAGYVTSAAFSPGLKSVIGLGYAQRDFAKQGTKLTVESENGQLPTVILKLV